VNPYSKISDRQFWRRAVSRVEPFALDPVDEPGFLISASDRVATAGSCFAQHISRSLVKIGFNYYVPEQPDPHIAPDEASRRSFGVFSCRYGNVYTARQLLQLLQEAFGEREPLEKVWSRDDGRFVDPYRPQIEPDGFSSPEEVVAERYRHLSLVRTMFEKLDVFIFTLGLTETWRSKLDGSVFPLAPGVSGGSFDTARHEFINLSVYEVERDLKDAIDFLRRMNPRSRIVLTVSPVPLIATIEARHVLVATTYSKSVLRVVAENIVRSYPNVEYFPSYELITGNFNRGAYYKNDLRDVHSLGVAHAMRLFLRHFAESPEGTAVDEAVSALDEAGPPAGSAVRRLPIDDIVCDEEAISHIRP
jgi:hypothetical protein